ncbi:uncharacterized protein LOC113874725 [Abrus precatorius]|uniref:Uncharacterized protein LOC113874725 n=1 Tax=Abrus precatorius TaxID=3816 RepID=A0A8B8MJH4_ABRPR|nr:uncharacterized protein LOC113874725 [Abrus precatorius]
MGTLGNSNLKEDSHGMNITAEDSSTSQDCVQEFTLQDLQNALNVYFQEQVESYWVTEQKENTVHQINQHLNSGHSSLKVEGKENETFKLGKKALAFLLKKFFVCRSGFQRTPSFNYLISTESRMEKILRAILHQKLHLQASILVDVIKKHLENRHASKSGNGEEEHITDAENGSKWNMTDSEYIILEI